MKTANAITAQLIAFVDADEHNESCEYGHLNCSTVPGGYCFDEAMTVLEDRNAF